jgi:hypothetical protein
VLGMVKGISPSLVGLGQRRVWPGGIGALVGPWEEAMAGVRDCGAALGMLLLGWIFAKQCIPAAEVTGQEEGEEKGKT